VFAFQARFKEAPKTDGAPKNKKNPITISAVISFLIFLSILVIIARSNFYDFLY
jgi:hypothetical protein